MENIQIHKVTANDAEFLHKLMNDEHVIDRLSETETGIDIWISAIIEWEKDQDEEDYIIYYNSIAIGWLGINNLLSADKKAYIKMIVILPEYQGRGIGKYVISQSVEHLRLMGYHSVILFTDNSNVVAQKCYKKCGFDITETIMKKMSNGKSIKRVKMEKVLKCY
ncbi:GNAT family N-acetyltransferase [Anaerocolumna sp. MB42-C2]|uniref:GNAT family N-acetyltransferase n=1 Tax=Anaerocolumna sp. MB42-C2 TaxID=3070997 RepID=UPI0027DF4C16|nr:GNAT family N-acetyltransferase [Anaerocolumna sp. MB42-C2]WMJ87400.1 GNAT family N-acetyltransferase [Anaerocolumna sp. MB42-C2]